MHWDYFEYLVGKLHALAFCLFAHVFVFNRLLLLTCKITSFFSVLHLAVNHGREQLVNQVLQLTEQMRSTQQSFIQSKNSFGYVSDL